MIGWRLLNEGLEHGDVDLTVGDSLWSRELIRGSIILDFCSISTGVEIKSGG